MMLTSIDRAKSIHVSVLFTKSGVIWRSDIYIYNPLIFILIVLVINDSQYVNNVRDSLRKLTWEELSVPQHQTFTLFDQISYYEITATGKFMYKHVDLLYHSF